MFGSRLTSRCRRASLILLPVLLLSPLLVLPAAALDPDDYADPAFQRTWERTDKPVEDGAVPRTWVWGAPVTDAVEEPYTEAPEQSRLVQYFDKTRMEITDPNGDQSSIWYVTNGLLVVELMSGLLQSGNSDFGVVGPAQVNVAGDPLDPDAVTYDDLAALTLAPPAADGATITQRVDSNGVVTNDPSLASFGVTAAHRLTVPGIDHQIASVFWDYMHSTGLVWENGGYTTANLFPDPYYATGFPKTEPYWTNVDVGGFDTLVLLQCFERRCLTYTPTNAPEWRVEMGNVGLHYHTWRYTPPPPAGEGLFVGYLSAVADAASALQPRREPNSTPEPKGKISIVYTPGAEQGDYTVVIDTENAGEITEYEIRYDRPGEPLKVLLSKKFDPGASTEGDIVDGFDADELDNLPLLGGSKADRFQALIESGDISIRVKTTNNPIGVLQGWLTNPVEAVFGAYLKPIVVGQGFGGNTSFYYISSADGSNGVIEYSTLAFAQDVESLYIEWDDPEGPRLNLAAILVPGVPNAGTITQADLDAQVGGMTIPLLAQQLFSGNANIVIATAANPNGELAGTTFPIDPDWQPPMYIAVQNGNNMVPVPTVVTDARGTGVFTRNHQDYMNLLVTSADLADVNGLQINLAQRGQNGQLLLEVAIPEISGEVNGVLGEWKLTSDMLGMSLDKFTYLLDSHNINLETTTLDNPEGAARGQVQFPYGLEPVALSIATLALPGSEKTITVMSFHAVKQPAFDGEAITLDLFCNGTEGLDSLNIRSTVDYSVLANVIPITPTDLENANGHCGSAAVTLTGTGASEQWQGTFNLWSPVGWRGDKVTFVATVIHEGAETELSGTPDILWEFDGVYPQG